MKMENGTSRKMKLLGIVYSIILVNVMFTSAQTATPTALIVDYDQTIIPSDLEPGDKKPLYIVIKNTGGLPARDVHVTLPTVGSLIAEGPSSDSISSAGNWFLGTINPGESPTVVTFIRVDADAGVGTQYLTLHLTYDESRYGSDDRLRTEEKRSKWIIPVDVKSGSLLELGDYIINPRELKAGYNIQLTFKLKNTGEADALDVKSYLGMPKDGSATNLQVNMYLATAFTVLGTTDKIIGDIAKGSEGVVDMLIHIDEDVEAKAYTLPITAEYEDDSGTKHTDIFYVGVYVSGDRKLSITNFESDPSKIHSDEEDVEFTGKIENQGTEQVKNVKVTFKPTFPLKNARSYIQTKEVGIIKGGNSTEFTFYADVEDNIKPQQTKVNFTLEYEVNSQVFHDEIAYTVDILEHPRFTVTLDAPPTKPSEKGVAKVKVNNVGSKCEDITLIVLEKRDQPFDFEEKSAYIGDLDEGEGGLASISYTVEDNAVPQPHIVPIEIRCTKNDEVLIYSKTMKLEVSQNESGANATLSVGICLVVLLVVLFFAYKIGHKHGHKRAKGAKE